MDQMELSSYISTGDVQLYKQFQNYLGDNICKMNRYASYDPIILFLDIFSQEKKHIQKLVH